MSMLPTYYSRNVVNVTGGSKTVAATDAGTVQNAVPTTVGATTTFTLPAAAAGLVGLSFTFRAGGPNNGDSPITVAPAAADAIAGLGFTAVVNKGAQALAAVVRAGDEITVRCSGVTGVGAWYVDNAFGTFTRVP